MHTSEFNVTGLNEPDVHVRGCESKKLENARCAHRWFQCKATQSGYGYTSECAHRLDSSRLEVHLRRCQRKELKEVST